MNTSILPPAPSVDDLMRMIAETHRSIVDMREQAREQARGAADAPKPMPKRAPNPMYREYDQVGHDSWTPAYRFGEEGVLDWMFAQRKAATRRPSTDGAASPAAGAPTGK